MEYSGMTAHPEKKGVSLSLFQEVISWEDCIQIAEKALPFLQDLKYHDNYEDRKKERGLIILARRALAKHDEYLGKVWSRALRRK